MKNFKQFLKENNLLKEEAGGNRGTSYEVALCIYFNSRNDPSLKKLIKNKNSFNDSVDNPQFYEAVIKRFEEEPAIGNGFINDCYAWASTAYKCAVRVDSGIACANTAEKAGEGGKYYGGRSVKVKAGSPKTDIFLKKGKYQVSVKMAGGIQLTSLQSDAVSKILLPIAKESMSKKDLKNFQTNILGKLDSLPPTMIDYEGGNIEKALSRHKVGTKKGDEVRSMFVDDVKGIIKEQFDYRLWFNTCRDNLKKDLINFLNNNKTFQYNLTEELITGKRTFVDNQIAVANSIITPTEFFKEIDSNVVNLYMKYCKYDLSAKSGNGLSHVNFRNSVMQNSDFQKDAEKIMNDAVSKISKKVKLEESKLYNNNSLNEGILDSLAGFWQKIKSFVSGVFKDTFNKLVNLFKKIFNIETVETMCDDILSCELNLRVY